MIWYPYPTSCTHQSLYNNMMKWTKVRWELNIWSLVLKVDSEATIVIGTTKTSLATAWRNRNFNIERVRNRLCLYIYIYTHIRLPNKL